MTKIKLRKRKRKVYFQYYPWIPLRYYSSYVYCQGAIGNLSNRPEIIIFDDIEG